MKKFVLLLSLIASSAFLIPTAAEARDRHHHSSSRQLAYHCRACGDSVYRERYYAGRDRHGHRIYSWRNIRHDCHPRHYGRGRGHDHHRHHSHGTRIAVPGLHFSIGR